MEKEELFKTICDAVVNMDEDKVMELCTESLNENISAYETITNGLINGMDMVGKLYQEGEYFLPEVLICSDAMNTGLDILKPHLDRQILNKEVKIVIGVVEGDTHDIGKNLVKIMMEAAGFNVIDLGRDVKLNKFIETAKSENANVICMSTLMTTTMPGMKTVIEMLNENKTRDKYTVMIGGGPVSQKYADTIGADIYTVDASSAVKKLKEVLGYEG